MYEGPLAIMAVARSRMLQGSDYSNIDVFVNDGLAFRYNPADAISGSDVDTSEFYTAAVTSDQNIVTAGSVIISSVRKQYVVKFGLDKNVSWTLDITDPTNGRFTGFRLNADDTLWVVQVKDSGVPNSIITLIDTDGSVVSSTEIVGLQIGSSPPVNQIASDEENNLFLAIQKDQVLTDYTSYVRKYNSRGTEQWESVGVGSPGGTNADMQGCHLFNGVLYVSGFPPSSSSTLVVRGLDPTDGSIDTDEFFLTLPTSPDSPTLSPGGKQALVSNSGLLVFSAIQSYRGGDEGPTVFVDDSGALPADNSILEGFSPTNGFIAWNDPAEPDGAIWYCPVTRFKSDSAASGFVTYLKRTSVNSPTSETKSLTAPKNNDEDGTTDYPFVAHIDRRVFS